LSGFFVNRFVTYPSFLSFGRKSGHGVFGMGGGVRWNLENEQNFWVKEMLVARCVIKARPFQS
jgi:hypothetical protein